MVEAYKKAQKAKEASVNPALSEKGWKKSTRRTE